MKIVLATGIYPPETGGPARRVPMLARALVNRGHEVSVVTYGDEKTEKGDGWEVGVVPRLGGVLGRYLRFGWRVFRRLKAADVVLAQSPVSDGLPTCIAAWLARKPFLLNVVGDYAWEIAQQNGETDLLDAFLEKRHGGKIGLLEKIERWVAKQAKKVIVPSKYLAGVVEKWGIEKSRVELIYNSIEPETPDEDRLTLRAEHGIPADAKLILTNVRAVPWKGVMTLLEAMEQLPEEFHLAHIGSGSSLEGWKHRAKQKNLESRVHWLGTMPTRHVAAWLDAADVFALPSGYEGYPFVVAEAMEAGLPSVVSDKAGNAEMGELYPSVVRVAPYQDVAAWVQMLQDVRPRFTTGTISLPKFEGVDGMVTAYEYQFKNVCAS